MIGLAHQHFYQIAYSIQQAVVWHLESAAYLHEVIGTPVSTLNNLRTLAIVWLHWCSWNDLKWHLHHRITCDVENGNIEFYLLIIHIARHTRQDIVEGHGWWPMQLQRSHTCSLGKGHLIPIVIHSWLRRLPFCIMCLFSFRGRPFKDPLLRSRH